MTPLLPFAAALAAALLIYGRRRRLARLPRRSSFKDPRPFALVAAAAAGLTVLAVGGTLSALIAPAPVNLRVFFTLVAAGVVLLQFREAMRPRFSEGGRA